MSARISDYEITQRKLQGESLAACLKDEDDVAYIYSLYWKLSPMDKQFQFGPLRIPPCENNPRELKPVRVAVYGTYLGRDRGNDEIEPQHDTARAWAHSCIIGHEQFGMFVPEGDEPTKQELLAALKRLEDFYRKHVDAAEASWSRNRDPRRINPVARIAGEYFGLNKEWLYDQGGQTVCPACKKSVPETAARCTNPVCGAILDWEKAYELGMVTRQDALEHGAKLKAAPGASKA